MFCFWTFDFQKRILTTSIIRLQHYNIELNREVWILLWTHCMCLSNKLHHFNSSKWTFLLNGLFPECFGAAAEFTGHILVMADWCLCSQARPPSSLLPSFLLFGRHVWIFAKTCCFPHSPDPCPFSKCEFVIGNSRCFKCLDSHKRHAPAGRVSGDIGSTWNCFNKIV